MLGLERYIVVTGHYGSGKTNLAVNLAVDLRKQGTPVTVVDLDIVNPYFRTADFRKLFSEQGIALIAPPFAGSNLDIPVLSAEVFSVFAQKEGYVIFDVGGDDVGAVALGMFRTHFERVSYSMLYVVNRYRYLTRTAEEACELLYEIEAASRLKATGVVNNSNLARDTVAKDIAVSAEFAQQVCNTLKLPLICTAAVRSAADELQGKAENIYPVDVYVKSVWD